MGWDLKPMNPSNNAPVDEDGGYAWGRYNVMGWAWLQEKLNEWGVNTWEFKNVNDGDFISSVTCLEVANAIEEHLHELDEEHRTWLEPHIARWRTCGGYRQY